MMRDFWEANARDSKAFTVWGSVAAVAANNSYAGVAAATGKELYIRSARWNLPSSTDTNIRIGIANSITGFSLGNTGNPLKGGAAASTSACYKRSNMTGDPAGFVLLDQQKMENVYVPPPTISPAQGRTFLWNKSPIILPAGYFLVAYPTVVNLPLEFFAEFVEKP